MNRATAIVLNILLLAHPIFGAYSPAQQNIPEQAPPGQLIIRTPFGTRIVPDPAAAQPPAQTPAAPVVTPPAPEQPAAPAIPQQPAQGPGAAAPAEDPEVPVQLDLDNADIHQLIRIIGDALGINYIIDPAVQGTVNIHTTGTLRRSDLLPILETLLKINGATMVRVGNFYQIIPTARAVQQPLEVQQQPQPAPDDQMVLQILRMRFVSAADMSGLLMPYLSEGANIVVHDAGNVILLTERRSNLRKLLEIVDIFDTNVFEGERVRMYPIRNNVARDIVQDLQAVFSGYAMSEGTGAVRFVSIDRLNSVLVITPNSTVFTEVTTWLERFDQPIQSAGRRTYVYKVRNSKAVDIQNVLAQLYGDQVQVSSVSAAASAAAQAAPATPAQGPPPAAAGAPAPAPFATSPAQAQTAIRAGNVRIIADQVNNALVVQATPQEYSEIERTIAELDVLPRQVLVDAQIYEVVLDDSLSLGLSAILQTRGTLANPITAASFAGSPPALAAQTFAFVGRTRELVAFLNASENRSRVRTLSAPSVLVSDNMTAEFTVGADVPVPTSSSITPVQAGGTNLFAQTISFRSTGVILRVRPQINDSGNVTLEIAQEVSQAGANTTSAVVAPVIGRSAVNSTIVLRDGQTVAIGGFIRETNELARSRVPLLGRLPGIGLLFGNTRKSEGRTELVVLITPHVLRTHEEADLATDALKSKLREIQRLIN